ncbi:MAG TPA: EAL domain-containing protein [Candidatus Limnocylindrales bacterium]
MNTSPSEAARPRLQRDRPDSTPDARPLQLGRFVGILTVVTAVFAVMEGVAFLAFGPIQLAVDVALFVGYGVWLHVAWRRMPPGDAPRFVTRLAMGMILIIVANAILQPTFVPELTVATILPIIAVLPYLDGVQIRRFIVFTWIVGVFVALMGEVMPAVFVLPTGVSATLRVLSMALAFGLALFLLWQFSTRLKGTARELGSLADLSSDLARTMDPLRIGDLMAQHLALATDAAECGICYWDQANDRVLTYGYYPRERRAAVDEAYPLAAYPATRRLLQEQSELMVRVDDDTCDPAEVAYLRSIEMGSMVMMPLIARGQAIGTIELYATGALPFDERRLRLARTLADEAAMALDNARLVEELRHQAFHDNLTGLANRGLFGDRVEHALALSARTGASIAVLFLDLDDFKTVNDRFGHAGGDEMLREVSSRIVEVLRPGDTAARLGGDEFAVLIEDLAGLEDAQFVADRLIDTVRAPIRIGDTDSLIGASVGIAVSTAGEGRAEDLLRNADFAMYRAKSAGKGRHELFQSHMREGIAERTELEGLIVGAVERGELRLQYQPIVELATRAIVGVEALVRWHPAGRRMLMPGDFISLAEETGQIVPIGRWVVDEACRQGRLWQVRLDDPTFAISVNLSARQFQHPGLVPEVLAAIRSSGIDPRSLILEITESVLMQHTASTIDKLAQLRAHGIRLAIDDFGTGYSSLSYLDRFPVDTLKIDRSFVDGFGAGREGPVLVRAIIELGHALGLDVVAEGIEREDQVGPLAGLGCKLGQGYLFARPLDAEALDALLDSQPAADEPEIVAIHARTAEPPAGREDRRRRGPGGGPRVAPARQGSRRSSGDRAG